MRANKNKMKNQIKKFLKNKNLIHKRLTSTKNH